jgi:hypothetical protein
VLYRETHTLLDDLADATLDGTRKEHMEFLVTVPLLIIGDLGMRKLPLIAAEELLEMLRTRQHHADLQSPGGRLGQAAGRRGRRQRHPKRTKRPSSIALTCGRLASSALWPAVLGD